MNEILTTPDVKLFVAAVREHLADLTEEEREELVGGLEGDMSDLVAERGVEALPEPAEYADELRAAAGFAAERRTRRSLPQRATRLVGAGRGGWAAAVERHPVLGTASVVVAGLAPAWWVLRAWVAVELLDLVAGPPEYLTVVPSLQEQFSGVLALVVAVAISVLIGTGRLWPGSQPRTRTSRDVLRLLNLAGVVALVAVLGHFPDVWESHGLMDGSVNEAEAFTTPPTRGLVADGHLVRNVFAYDSSGRPVVGIQLFDQHGRPLMVDKSRRLRTEDGFGLTYPWRNGNQDLYNVFPLPVRTQPGSTQATNAWSSSNPPALPSQPLAVVPPVALPHVTPSVLVTPQQLEAQTALSERQARELAQLRAQVRALKRSH